MRRCALLTLAKKYRLPPSSRKKYFLASQPPSTSWSKSSNHLPQRNTCIQAQQYLHKGSKVYIEGSLHTRQWTDQSGQIRYITEVRGNKLEFMDSQSHNEKIMNTIDLNHTHHSQAITYTKPKTYHYTHDDYDTCDDYEYNGEKICGVCDTPISGDECYNCEIGD